MCVGVCVCGCVCVCVGGWVGGWVGVGVAFSLTNFFHFGLKHSLRALTSFVQTNTYSGHNVTG